MSDSSHGYAYTAGRILNNYDFESCVASVVIRALETVQHMLYMALDRGWKHLAFPLEQWWPLGHPVTEPVKWRV